MQAPQDATGYLPSASRSFPSPVGVFGVLVLVVRHQVRMRVVMVRADLARSVKDRGVIILDDVFDTGRTLAFAKAHMQAKGAREVITCALTQKPWAPRGEQGVDYCAIDAPGRYLVGYGMDDAGKYRGLPYIGALD